MTTRSIFAINGPAVATVLAGNYVAGMMFQVTTSGQWFTGFRWWCCNAGQSTAPVKCALWNPKSSISGDGALVPGTTVTSGTLTPGAWNLIPLAAPVPIAIGTPYLAAIAQDGNFPFTTAQFGIAQPFANGIVNGPLIAYSDSSLGATVNATPYTLPQSSFRTDVGDPVLGMPNQGNTSFNSWADVLVSDTTPAAYAGTYRLWPNKFDASPATGADTNLPFTLAHQVNLSQRCVTSFVWWYSIAGAASLPTAAQVWSVGSQLLVAQNAAPSWLLPDGSGPAVAGGGWCKTALTATLPAGAYKVACYNSGGGAASWSSREFGYWLTGAGSAGITSGPISSPAQGAAASAYVWQSGAGSTPPFTNGVQQEPQNGTFFQPPGAASTGYPYLGVDFNFSVGAPAGAIAENFWVDLEVTPMPLPLAGGGDVPDSDRSWAKRMLIW